MLGIIGGSGFSRVSSLKILRKQVIATPYGMASASLTYGQFDGVDVVFMPRHGPSHTIPPHKVNYRANIWALHHAGVKQVVAVAAVGGISEAMEPGRILVPDQIIDYTYGRFHTFFEEGLNSVTHIDFTYPYCEQVRKRLLASAAVLPSGNEMIASGTYGATQGPRLETAAEIRRMQRDGCDVVGMTGMPEAALAREIGLCYGCCALVVNWAAGVREQTISMAEIERNLESGMEQVRSLIAYLAANTE
jgi:5'-methylthioinosine phosphorylase